MNRRSLATCIAIAAVILTPRLAAAQEWFEQAYGVGTYAQKPSADLQAQVRYYRNLIGDASRKTAGPDLSWYADVLTRARANMMQVLKNRGALPDDEARWAGPGTPWPPPGAGSGGGGDGSAGTAGATGGGSGSGGTGRNTTRVPASLGGPDPGRPRVNTIRVPRPADGSGAAGGGDAGGATGAGEGVRPSPSIAIPLTVVLTAARATECSLKGKSTTDCIAELMLAAAGAATAGKLVALLTPQGQVIATGVALFGTVVLTGANVIQATVEGAGAVGAGLEAMSTEAGLAERRRLNAIRWTPARQAALLASFRERARLIFDASGEELTSYADVTAALKDLQSDVAAARAAFEAFSTLNSAARAAADRCRNPEQNPVRHAVDLQNRVAQMGPRSERILNELKSARELAGNCGEGDRAQRAYEYASNGVGELRRIHDDALADIRDAASFFPGLKNGRSAADEAANRIGAIEAALEAARKHAAQLTSAINRYRSVRDTALARTSEYLAVAEAFKGAFPSPPPSDVAAALREIDAIVPPDQLVYFKQEFRSNDQLRVIARTAARSTEPDSDPGETEPNRIEGLLREARRQFETMRACEGLTDEMPSALTQLLEKMGTEAAQRLREAQTALDRASDIPTQIAGCTKTAPAAAGATPCQRLGNQILSVFTSPGFRPSWLQDDDPSDECHLAEDRVKYRVRGNEYGGMQLNLWTLPTPAEAAERMLASVRIVESGNRPTIVEPIGDAGLSDLHLATVIFRRGRYFVAVKGRNMRNGGLQYIREQLDEALVIARMIDGIISKW